MKIATFNIQNLFHRHIELYRTGQSKNKIDWMAELDALLKKAAKNERDNERIKDLSVLAGFGQTHDLPYAVLKKRGGNLCFTGQAFENSTKASFLTDWEGWVKVANRPLHQKAVFSKAYVVGETDPDILVLQEVEDRSSLMEFNSEFLPLLKISPYREVMVFETNNPRGLGMGILLKDGYRLKGVKNHLSDLDSEGFVLFDTDCQEYEIGTPDGNRLWILSTQFSLEEKSRKQQSEKVAEVYARMQAEGKNVVVCGTLNDVSYSDALSPLIRGTDLKDVSRHKQFKTDTDHGKGSDYFRLGAYRLGVNIKQKDYLLLPPILNEKVRTSGMNRKGTWAERRPNWALYPSIANKHHAASEHPLIWAEIML